MSFTVGQLAKLTGLTVRALHHYDAIGLLVPSQRSDSGYRLYTQSDVVRLYRIQALRHFGLSLAEIEGALAREGATLPEIIAKQLSALDSQIEQATLLRARLARLQEVLTHGSQPATGDWLAAVELSTQYDKYCSPEELRRLIGHSDAQASWQELIDDVQEAMQVGLSPHSAGAQALLQRWSALMLRSVGGDLNLALKMKLAYANDPGMQARMKLKNGMGPEMMAYLGQVATHGHLTLWSRHLKKHEVERLRPGDAWQQRLLQVVGALRHELSHGSPATSEAVSRAVAEWDALVDDFVAGDGALRSKVLAALGTDPDLQHNWIMDAEIQRFIARARDAV